MVGGGGGGGWGFNRREPKNRCRYLYYPDESDCCYCCNAAAGCGLLKPDWLNDAEFKGNVTYTFQDGSTTEAYKWEKDGLQASANLPLRKTRIAYCCANSTLFCDYDT